MLLIGFAFTLMAIGRRNVPGIAVILAAACGGCGGGSASAPSPGPAPVPPPPGPPMLAADPVFDTVNLSFPVAMVQAPGDDSRWFAIERAGRVSVFDNMAGATRRTVLNFTAAVDSSFNEAGLLGIAFHPDFASNGEVFLSYTRSGAPLESVISRFTSNDGGETVDPASEQVILSMQQPFANHNGGNIVFGPDGYLYAGFGDGGSGGDPLNNGQDTTNLFGTILRIDIDGGPPYEIPADNPFAGNALCIGGVGGPCPEIFAWGFRNPWRFSFDRATGQLWAGDVGQISWEEIDRVELGSNYGWSEREGAHDFKTQNVCLVETCVDPVTEYGRALGISVTGGYVYRGTAIPGLAGFYVFGDFGTGRIWAVAADAPPGSDPIEVADTDFSIPTFAEDADGELYVIDFASPAGIYRLVDAM